MSSIVTSDAAEIRREVTKVLGSFATAARNASDASTLAKAEGDKAIGARETLATAIAKAAHDGKWNSEDVGAIVADVLKTGYNGGKGALATFAGEIKTVCAPRVRPHISALFATAREAWDAETAAIAASDKPRDVPKPLREEFARHYHMVIAAAKALRDASREPDSFAAPTDFVRWANDRQRARQIDYAKVFARKEAIAKEIRAFYRDFPVDGLDSAAEFLETVTRKDLEDCVKPQVAPEPEQDDDAAEPAQGASDLLEDALADMTGLTEMKAAAD